MKRLIVIADMILAVLIFGGFRAIPRVENCCTDPAIIAYANNIAWIVAGLILALLILNGGWLIVASRRRIASGAIGTAAMGVRASRWIGTKASAVKQQVIDRADQP